MKKLFALFLLGPTFLYAQSRFNGKWKMKENTVEFSNTPERYLLDKGMYHCLTCVPRVDVKADGSYQKETGHGYADTISVRVVDAHSVVFTFKKDDKTTFVSNETVSPDGKTMTEDYTDTRGAKPRTGNALFTRLGDGPSGSHALSGSWRMRTDKTTSTNASFTTYEATKDGLRMSDDNGESYEAKFDGKDYPVPGDLAHTMVSLKRISDATIEMTIKQEGKLFGVRRMTVSKDGKSIRVEVNDKQRGATSTWTMERLP